MIKFSEKSLDRFKEITATFPTRESTFLPVLQMARNEFGTVNQQVALYLSELYDLPVEYINQMIEQYKIFIDLDKESGKVVK